MSPTRRFLVQPPRPPIDQGLADIQAELKLPMAFPAEVEAAAVLVAAHPRLPDLDRTDIALVTIDPAESMDLDQALYVERRDGGFRVYYAIADVAAFVTAGDAIDVEANLRGEKRCTARTRRFRCIRRCSRKMPPLFCLARFAPHCCGPLISTRPVSARPSTCDGRA